jgi:hypothetical protein
MPHAPLSAKLIIRDAENNKRVVALISTAQLRCFQLRAGFLAVAETSLPDNGERKDKINGKTHTC